MLLKIYPNNLVSLDFANGLYNYLFWIWLPHISLYKKYGLAALSLSNILLLVEKYFEYLEVEGFLKDHFFNEQIGSALSRRSPPDSDRVPLWIFWPEHLVLLFPISLLFPAAVKASLQRLKDRRPRLSEE